MPNLDRRQLLGVVVLLITAAFVGARWVKPPFGVWWRRAVIVSYLLAVGLALLWVAQWFSGT
jgi:hypothetical protein